MDTRIITEHNKDNQIFSRILMLCRGSYGWGKQASDYRILPSVMKLPVKGILLSSKKSFEEEDMGFTGVNVHSNGSYLMTYIVLTG